MKFIWISGSINSGKSTIAAALNKRINKSVNIEWDALRHFAHNEKLEDIGEYIAIDALDLAKKWSDRGFLPIINSPLYGDCQNIFEYSNKLGLEPVITNLIPEKEIAMKNRGERELTEKELKRIEYMYDECGIRNPEFGMSIDNTNQSVDETVEEVMKIIEEIVKPYL
jgi:thymidylate kinase